MGTPKFAIRIMPKAVWDDLILPEEEKVKLHEIAAKLAQCIQVRGEFGFKSNSAKGPVTKVLFSGSSGTGKTMAAEVLANELHRSL